ncbi:MAG: glycoside hydrolase family 38 C-terminal domain-containing protein [Eubacteriales bacterium]|nr:glycoside hydrolase family 38 C-terminal domain-containing protein [Eubacteriales bacterium]
MSQIMCAEYRDRLEQWMRVLQTDFYQPIEEIVFEGFYTMDQLTPEEAACHGFQPIAPDTLWGRTWEYCWLRAKVTVPHQAQGEAIVLNLGFEGEATLFVNGEAFGTKRAEWITMPHHYMVDNVLTQNAQVGETFDLLIEVYAGHYYPDTGSCATGPILPGALEDPAKEGERRSTGRSSFGIWNEEAYQLYMDVSTLSQLLEELPSATLRASEIADALEGFTNIVDFEQPLEQRRLCYKEARRALQAVMSAQNGDTQAVMYAIGNAHIDLVWLWPLAETIRKTARTFAQQLRLLKRYPEYRYLQSQPALYELCRQHYPKLYEQIKEAAREGRWIADGAMYVEPDTNMAGGEALVRQLLYGKRFYQEEFGVDSQLLWLPDTFGYTAALPQLLKSFGVKYLVTQKIFWSYNEGDTFPYHYFTWKGMDGSEVVSFLPTSYTYRTDPSELCKVWNQRVQKRNLDAFLIPFGYGDGGGGPCRDHIEYALREKDMEGMPKVRIESPTTFFHDMEEKGGPVNTWEGELYFSAHRGTYTAQAAIKRNNRRSELCLRDAELWNALRQYEEGGDYPAETLERLWKVLLVNQFHDILPGSSIARVYREANEAHEALQREAEALIESALEKPEMGCALYNGLSWQRRAVVTLPEAFARGAITAEGQPISVLDGQAFVEIPSMGRLGLRPAVLEPAAPAVFARQDGQTFTLENQRVILRFNAVGEMTLYLDKQSGRRYENGFMNHLQMFKDTARRFDAWDIDSMYDQCPVELLKEAEITVEKAQGLSASLLVKRRLDDTSLMKQRIRLDADSYMVLFETEIDWHEQHRLLKVAFDTGVHTMDAYHEMQFGYVARPAHRSRAYDKDRFEVCNHRYTALCDGGHGCAVLNDSKYGVSAENGIIGLTLLRASTSPDRHADQGIQRFNYGFIAWEGDWMDSPAVRAGYELNVPVRLGGGVSGSALSLTRDNVIVDTVKAAEDHSGDLILRLYEAKNADVLCGLHCALPYQKASLCDMQETVLEECKVENEVIQLHFKPFQIVTLRLHR